MKSVSRNFLIASVAALTAFSASAVSQTIPGGAARISRLHLKTRTIVSDSAANVETIQSANPNVVSHFLLQFRQTPTTLVVEALKGHGVQVLADVPENALLVAIQGTVDLSDLGVAHVEAITGSDKVSPMIEQNETISASEKISPVMRRSTSRGARGYFVVEFHPDVDINQAQGILLNIPGVNVIQNPDLNARHLLIQVIPVGGATQAAVLANLTDREEVSYVFPASNELANRIPTRPYSAGVTANGAAVQSIPTYGEGWDGAGKGSATLNYVFSSITSQVPAATVKSEIQRAMAEWSKVANIKWQLGSNASGTKTVNIIFATGNHGDGYSFDGRGNVLAHTFYPSAPNPEPLAGDMHFDDAERWNAGADTDVFSVALHELGHALGLGHSDDPTAVMYPYYRLATTLAAPDKAAILTMYAPASNTDQPTPLTLIVNAGPVATTAATISLSGSVTGGSGTAAISWTNGAAQGTAAGTSAWTIASLPLTMGTNTITVTATAGTTSTSQIVTVVRQNTTTPTTTTTNAPAAPKAPTAPTTPTTDKTAPTLVITSPGAATVTSTAATVIITGAASDNVGVAMITWSNNFGASGMASGTAAWSASVPLLTGSNTITVRAFDAAGNSSWRTLVITRK